MKGLGNTLKILEGFLGIVNFSGTILKKKKRPQKRERFSHQRSAALKTLHLIYWFFVKGKIGKVFLGEL